MERVRVHSCTNVAEIVERERTLEEQARIDAARPAQEQAGVEANLRVLRAEAVKALAEAGLAAALENPNAPQAVKDYAAALAR